MSSKLSNFLNDVVFDIFHRHHFFPLFFSLLLLHHHHHLSHVPFSLPFLRSFPASLVYKGLSFITLSILDLDIYFSSLFLFSSEVLSSQQNTMFQYCDTQPLQHSNTWLFSALPGRCSFSDVAPRCTVAEAPSVMVPKGRGDTAGGR